MKIKLLLLTIFSISLLFSCDNNESDFNTGTKVNFWLDAEYPAETDEISVEIKEFQYLLEYNGEENWITPEDFKSGVHTFNRTQKEINSLLAKETGRNGTITKIKIILGKNHKNKINDENFDITVDSELENIMNVSSSTPGLDFKNGEPKSINIKIIIDSKNTYKENVIERFTIWHLDESQIFYDNTSEKTYYVEYQDRGSEWKPGGAAGSSTANPSYYHRITLFEEGNWDLRFYYNDNRDQVIHEYKSLFLEQGQKIYLGEINLDEIVKNKANN